MLFNFSENENRILKFWKDNKIFEKLRKKNEGKKRWSFLDGPITVNNPMGVHHAWGRTYKDLFQRFNAMRGFDQRFQNGFDCQGLWVEVEVEKELGFKTKKDIEKYGIDKFVEKCKERVIKYSEIMTEQSKRLGQWMDWENSYYTMSDENNYAIWSFLKKCYEKGYLYKGRDSVPWCPRCGTAISQHEILTEEYQLITHKAVYFKLPIIDGGLKGAKLLVWTTTPWTIPANVALVVNPDFEYGLFENKNEKLILLKDLAEKILGKDFVLKKTFREKDLKGLKYEGPFDNLPRVNKTREENPETFHTVVLDKDLVTAEEGTGIVHTAPGAGEEDFKISQREKLSVIEVIDESAIYLEGLGEFSGKNAKENPEIILDYLKQCAQGKFFFKIENYEHRYPTCWRCKQELVWRVVDEWYISMDKLRKPLEQIVEKVRWIPEFGLDRELDWLKNMHDWLISKKRYWGLVLPIYECQCGNFEVIGSKEELKKRAVEGWEKFEGKSPHKPWVDFVKIKCRKCGQMVSRIPDVGNPWLDAGIVPFSTMKYQEDKNFWKKWFPADLVCESFPGQFKNWFYSLLVMSSVLENTNPMKTIFGYALVRDEKGEEMHKSKGNAIWFDEAVEKAGADPMRWMYSKANPSENLNFGYHALEEIKRKLLNLYNSFAFFKTYVKKDEIKEGKLESKNVLDAWIISRLNNLIEKATKNLDNYNSSAAVIAIEDFFINDLSLWYIRRSRERFHKGGKGEKEEAIETLYHVLLNLTKLIAPIMPFFAEELYSELKSDNMPASVHLQDWPEVNKKLIDNELEESMSEARKIVTLALAKRAEKGIKIRQLLMDFTASSPYFLSQDIKFIIAKELNVKEAIIKKSKETKIDDFNWEITEELSREGNYREFLRHIKAMRKELGLTPEILVSGIYSTFSDITDTEQLKKDAGAKEFFVVKSEEEIRDVDIKKETEIRKGKRDFVGIDK